MFLKSFGLMAPIVLGGLYMSGGLGGGYEREVGRPPAEVMAALDDLDLAGQPGSPGTDASRSGGVLPTFVLERGTDTMTWKVMSGTLVATSMTARFEPLEGGTRTRVTTSVRRGNAPDDLVSPAFRSTSVTKGLFVVALEDELDALTLPAGGSPEKCRELLEQMQNESLEGLAGDVAGPRVEKSGLGRYSEGTRAIMKVNGMEMRLRAAGCDTSGGGEFREVENTMGSASAMSDSNPVRRNDEPEAYKKKDPVFTSDSDINALGRR